MVSEDYLPLRIVDMTCFAIAIQLAKLSGFSPIIATASLHNEAYLKSIGVTHVIDRAADPIAEVPKLVGTTPVEVVFSSAPDRSVWATALDVVSPGGTLILAAPPPPPPHLKEKYSDRYIANVYANFQLPQYKALGESLYGKLTQLLEDGSLKVGHRFGILSGNHSNYDIDPAAKSRRGPPRWAIGNPGRPSKIAGVQSKWRETRSTPIGDSVSQDISTY